eukprot:jgi/Mesvir1/22036/Mv12268-RA.1
MGPVRHWPIFSGSARLYQGTRGEELVTRASSRGQADGLDGKGPPARPRGKRAVKEAATTAGADAAAAAASSAAATTISSVSLEQLLKTLAYEGSMGYKNCQGRSGRFHEFMASQLQLLGHELGAGMCQIGGNPASALSTEALDLSLRFSAYPELDHEDRVTFLDETRGFVREFFRAETEGSVPSHESLMDESPSLSGDSPTPQRTPNRDAQAASAPAMANTNPSMVADRQRASSATPHAGQTWAQDEAGRGPESLEHPVGRNMKEVVDAAPSLAGSISASLHFPPTGPVDRVTPSTCSAGSPPAFSVSSTPLESLAYLTPRQRRKLMGAGFGTLRDVLEHFPRYAGCMELEDAQIDEQAEPTYVSFAGRIVSASARLTSKENMSLLEIRVAPFAANQSVDMWADEPPSTGKDPIAGWAGRGKEAFRSGTETSALSSSSSASTSPPLVILTRFFFGARCCSNGFLYFMGSRFPAGSLVGVVGKVSRHKLYKNCLASTQFEIEQLTKLPDDEDDETDPVDNDMGADGSTTGSAGSVPLAPTMTAMASSRIEAGATSASNSAIAGTAAKLMAELRQSKSYLVPMHPSKAGLSPAYLREVIKSVLQQLPDSIDPVPPHLLQKYDLDTLPKAYVGIHFPTNAAMRDQARTRLVFDQFFYMQLSMLVARQQAQANRAARTGQASLLPGGGAPDPATHGLTGLLIPRLPFALTGAQLRVLREICSDLDKNVPMRRLLQGDVGSGKTVVALLALLHVVEKGLQGAMMAPTEILAEQHVARMRELLERLPPGCLDPQGGLARDGRGVSVRIELLTGSTSRRSKREIYEGLADGSIHIVVGTHALLSDPVAFARLGLAVVDEQHRFGVQQRLDLLLKGSNSTLPYADTTEEEAGWRPSEVTGGSRLEVDGAKYVEGKSPADQTAPPTVFAHELAMSATPIPRSLALALYGDMDFSTIDELPPGRIPVETIVVKDTKQSRASMYKKVRKELQKGGRAFVIFPLVEKSEYFTQLRAVEDEYESLRTQDLEGFACGLLHGQMSPADKEAAMQDFADGRTQVLLSTTVVEVGVDVPDASVMVVEHAERFGLAQLHQLRGRVGRGDRPSKCFLLSSNKEVPRLQALERTHNGFILAEIDMKIRGPGELVGTRQSGRFSEFSLASLVDDAPISDMARAAAEELLAAHPQLRDLPDLLCELQSRPVPVELE